MPLSIAQFLIGLIILLLVLCAGVWLGLSAAGEAIRNAVARGLRW